MAEFLLRQWSRNSYANHIGEHVFFFAAGNNCMRLSVVDGKVMSDQVENLNCAHEEVDTIILLHAKHAASRRRNHQAS